MNVDVELCRLSELSSINVKSYKYMWAYRNHYRIYEEGDQVDYVTQDYRIAYIFGVDEFGRIINVSMVGV